MVDSRVVANEFIRLARERGESLTPMQILKLVYIAHGWMLALYHRPLIDDEVEAWQYGPVIPWLYRALRDYRGTPVTKPIGDVQGELDPSEASIVRQVFEQYGHLSGPALSRLTHARKTPWALVYEPGEFGVTIPNDLIEDHYSSLAE